MNKLADIVRANVTAALLEDVGDGDLTASLVAADTRAVARVISREAAVLCGRGWFDEVFRQIDPTLEPEWSVDDGEALMPDQTLCQLEGNARAILTGERAALNFLQTLSGTATTASSYAQAVAGTGARILDTRKTLPGLRQAQKYAVRCGGCTNHRIGLYDGILIKENHIRSTGGIGAAVAAARALGAAVPVEVEIESGDQLSEALEAGADIIMLDNFTLAAMREAVARNRQHRHPAKLEVSGNVSLATVREIAETGVDYISIGALTKHVRAIDLSMQFRL